MALLTPKSIYAATKYFVLTKFFFFLKNAYFEQKLIKYFMDLTWVGSNHLYFFSKMEALSSFLRVDTHFVVINYEQVYREMNHFLVSVVYYTFL